MLRTELKIRYREGAKQPKQSLIKCRTGVSPVIIKQKWIINVGVKFIEPVIKQYVQAQFTNPQKIFQNIFPKKKDF